MSDEVPDTPSRPDSLLSQASTSSMGTPSWRARWPGRVGSTSPDLVPIISPSKGVNPMDVSTDTPPRTAAAEQPLPSCREMSFDSNSSLEVRAEYCSAMKRWASP